MFNVLFIGHASPLDTNIESVTENVNIFTPIECGELLLAGTAIDRLNRPHGWRSHNATNGHTSNYHNHTITLFSDFYRDENDNPVEHIIDAVSVNIMSSGLRLFENKTLIKFTFPRENDPGYVDVDDGVDEFYHQHNSSDFFLGLDDLVKIYKGAYHPDKEYITQIFNSIGGHLFNEIKKIKISKFTSHEMIVNDINFFISASKYILCRVEDDEKVDTKKICELNIYLLTCRPTTNRSLKDESDAEIIRVLRHEHSPPPSPGYVPSSPDYSPTESGYVVPVVPSSPDYYEADGDEDVDVRPDKKTRKSRKFKSHRVVSKFKSHSVKLKIGGTNKRKKTNKKRKTNKRKKTNKKRKTKKRRGTKRRR